MPTDTPKTNNTAAQIDSVYEVPSGPIQIFLSKFNDWKFNFPSRNLWTVEIRMHNDGSTATHSILELYKNINAVNTAYKGQNGTNWVINKTVEADFANSYLNQLQTDKTALFLAQGVSMEYRNVAINDNISDMLAPYSGFIKYGMSEVGTNYAPTARIQFYETNWDLGDIFFDKWIAAIGQQGLLEDSRLPNIKSDIFINQYSSGVSTPIKKTGKYTIKDASWQLRKVIKLLKAVPTSRSGTETTDYNNDGPRTETVEFKYLDYQIEYQL